MKVVRVGIIGGGLMGREFASAAARWCHLLGQESRPEIVAIADLAESARQWFAENIPTILQTTDNYKELLANPEVDAVYCAVPHHLHEKLYIDTIRAGKHLLGEKPFGIDRAANNAICQVAAEHPQIVVRCVSQFPFFPGPQRIYQMMCNKAFGKIIEVEAGFLHSSDLDPNKKINWKRMIAINGEYGCMGDLGMHALHMLLRAGWDPQLIFAVLSNIRPSRMNAEGEWVECQTWDNATLCCRAQDGANEFPMTVKVQRIAPGETDTWYLSVLGDRRSARFTTKAPRSLQILEYDTPGGPQRWQTEDLGYESVYPAVTGHIFEFGFSDAIQQMFAAFVEQVARGNDVELPFGCATLDETRRHHAILTAALESHRDGKAVTLL